MAERDVELMCMGCMKQKENEGKCPVCDFDEQVYDTEPHHLPLRTILSGKYLVGKVIGEGGFGITYIGWDLNIDVKIAIKEFYPTGFATRENTVTNTVSAYVGEKAEFFEKGKKKFVEEAKALGKFYALPGIVSVRDFFYENGTAYIVMEYVDGMTFKSYLDSMGGKIPAGQMFEMMKPLINSLKEVHKAGIIHRDISPDNIMVTKEGNVKLIDFGAARDFAGSGNKSLSVMLKPGYAPEEQYRSRGIQGPWTDVYALCATTYRAITGMKPEEATERLVEDTLETPSKLGVFITPPQDRALMRGLSVRQQERQQNMEELFDELYGTYENTIPNEDNKEVISGIDNTTEIEKPVLNKSRKRLITSLISIGATVLLGCIILIITLSESDGSSYKNDNWTVGGNITQISDSITELPEMTVTLKPTATPKPTVTPRPTATPEPTATMTPTPTVTPTPRPIVLEQPVWADNAHNYVYFGRYPQSEITGSDLTGQIKNAEYDENGVAIINGESYKRLCAKDVYSPSTGDNRFYDWSDEGYHYFKFEPIEWRVLYSDDEEVFLLAEYGIDTQPYNIKDKTVTWKNCTLRSWLNGYGKDSNKQKKDYSGDGVNFISMAFNESEQECIIEKTLTNPDNSEHGTAGGADTEDKVFLLSLDDCINEKYGFNTDPEENDIARRAYTTDFCKAMGTWFNAESGVGGWWLRSPGGLGFFASCVEGAYDYGDVYYFGNMVNLDMISIRPALYVNLSDITD